MLQMRQKGHLDVVLDLTRTTPGLDRPATVYHRQQAALSMLVYSTGWGRDWVWHLALDVQRNSGAF